MKHCLKAFTAVAGCVCIALSAAAFSAPAKAKWPAWLSIESPVNPFDPATRGAIMLVHAMTREGVPRINDLSGSAEGLVGGQRRSLAIHFDTTRRPGVFAIRRQWPAEGSWIVRVSLHTTTALIAMDDASQVAWVREPLQQTPGGNVPRAIAGSEIDSALAVLAKR